MNDCAVDNDRTRIFRCYRVSCSMGSWTGACQNILLERVGVCDEYRVVPIVSKNVDREQKAYRIMRREMQKVGAVDIRTLV